MKRKRVYPIILILMFFALIITNTAMTKNVEAYTKKTVQYSKAKSSTKTVAKTTLKPQMAINTAYVTKSGNNNMLKLWGYAVNKSGIKGVNIYLNNKYLGSAKIGQARQDMASKFKAYPNGSKSGYSAYLNVPSSVGTGNKTLKVVAVGNDKTTGIATKNILIKVDLKPQTVINTAYIIKNKLNNTAKLWGYAANKSGIKAVNIYIDNKYIGSAKIGLERKDVAAKFKAYPNGDKSGFSAQIILPAGMGVGNKILKVKAVGKDGSTCSAAKNVTVKSRLIVIDPGHLGHDTGTVPNGYKESELNAQVSEKLKNEFEKLGYKVAMTRSALRPDEYKSLDEKEELRQRSNFANDLKADLFISIHHNSVEDKSKWSTVSGIAAYYSTWKPGIKDVKDDLVDLKSNYTGKADTKPTEEAKFSKKLAEKAQSELAKECKYPKGECVDRNLAVTVRTNMPAVLFELGFICNPKEAARCADTNEQVKKAKVIAKVVNEMF